MVYISYDLFKALLDMVQGAEAISRPYTAYGVHHALFVHSPMHLGPDFVRWWPRGEAISKNKSYGAR